MISIDTSKAFDTIDRQVMLQELRAAGVDANDIAVIMALRSHIGYHPCKTDAEARIESRRGVRQGCTLAPTLNCPHEGHGGADRPLLGARLLHTVC